MVEEEEKIITILRIKLIDIYVLSANGYIQTRGWMLKPNPT